MEETQLDLKDRKILYQLDFNSRQTNAELGRKVGLSKEVVNYRIQRLEKEGFIKGYHAIIDSTRIGYMSFRVYIKLIDTPREKEEEILSFLKNHKKVFFVLRTEGEWDISFGIWAKNVFEYERTYFEFKVKFKQYIGREDFAVYTTLNHFHRAYLLNKNTDNEPVKMMGSETPVHCDNDDLKILEIIASNPRIPIVDISKRLDIPASTIAYKIKQLEKKKIILGYKLIFNFKTIGYEYFKVDIILKDVSRLNQIVSFCHNNPNIIYTMQTLGGADLEVFIEVKNNVQLLGIMDKLREKFPEVREWDYYNLEGYEKFVYFLPQK